MSRILKALLFVGLAVLCIAIWINWSIARLTVTPEPFNSAQWKEKEAVIQGSSDPECARGAMALGAIESREFIGKASAELTSLLGQPESIVDMRWFYQVGQCSGDWVPSALVLTFGKDGAVLEAQLKRDR